MSDGLEEPLWWCGARFVMRMHVPEVDGVKQVMLWTAADSQFMVATDILELDATPAEIARCLVDALSECRGKPADPVAGLRVEDQELLEIVRPHVSDRYDVAVHQVVGPVNAWGAFRAALGHEAYPIHQLLGWSGAGAARFVREAAALHGRAPWARDGPQGVFLSVDRWDLTTFTMPTRNPIEDGVGVSFAQFRRDPNNDTGEYDVLCASFLPMMQVPPVVAAHLGELGFDAEDAIPLLGVHVGVEVLRPPTARDFDVGYALCRGLNRLLDEQDAGVAGSVELRLSLPELEDAPTMEISAIF